MATEALSLQTIVEIPLDKILPNPENPAGPVQPEEAQAMAESLKAAGQEAEIRVWALTPEEKQAHAGYEYLLLGGHVRLEGAKLAGWTSLRAVVVGRTNPDEEFLAATLDNKRRDPGWWRDDLAIERLLMPTKGKGQAKVAAQLGLSPAKVNESWWITQALTPPAREWVAQNLRSAKTKNKGFLITRKTLLTLADLEDPAVVERALRVVLDDHLGEERAKKLVEWVKGGNKPEDFPLHQGFGGQVGQKGDKAIPTASKSHPKDPQKSGQPEIPPSQTGPIGTAPRDDSQETSKPGPDTTQGQGTSVDTGTQIGAVISGNILWKKIQDAPGRILTGVYPRYIRIFNWVRGWVEKAGVKHKFWATVITMFLLLWAGSTVISVAERFLKWAVFRVSWSAKYGKISDTSTPSQTAPPTSPNTAGVAPLVANDPAQKGSDQKFIKRPSQKSHAGKKALSHESYSSQLTAGSVSAIPAWSQEVLPQAGDFANRFYGISFSNWADTLAFLRAQMTGTTTQAMVDQYFPPALQQQMQKNQLAEYFSSGPSPKVLGGSGDMAQVLVQGKVTTQTRLGRTPQTLSIKPVALLLTFRHAEGIGSKIEKVEEVDASKVAAQSPNADLGKQIGDTVHNAHDAVNTTQEGTDTIGTAKKLLGF